MDERGRKGRAEGPRARPGRAAPRARHAPPRGRRAAGIAAVLAVALACAALAPAAGADDSDRPGPPPTFSGTPERGTVLLEWVAPAWNGTSNITGYTIMRSPTPSNYTLLATIGNVLHFQDITTERGHTYYYVVMAVNDAGPGQPSAVLEIKVPRGDEPRLPAAGALAAAGAIALACCALGPPSRRRGA